MSSEQERKDRHAAHQRAQRDRLRREGMVSLTTYVPAELLQFLTEQRDQAGHSNLGVSLAEILSEHRARIHSQQSKDSTVSA